MKILKVPEKLFLQKEGSQSGRVPIFANPEGSQFCQSGGVLFLSIRNGPIFANPEGYYFCQSGGVLNLPIWRGPVFANPEGSYFC